MRRFLGLCFLLFIVIVIFSNADNHTSASSPSKTEASAPAKIVLIGQKAVAKTDFPSCKSKDDLERLKVLMGREHDLDAANAYFVEHDCQIIKKGSVGSVEDLSAWTNNSCIRMAGEPDCYWYPQDFLEEAAAK